MSRRYVERERELQLPSVTERGLRRQNPPGMTLRELLREDLRTHDGDVLEQGFWAIAVNRFGNSRLDAPRIFRKPLSLVYVILEKLVQMLAGITLSYRVKLGRRVRIWHHGGIMIDARFIGDDVHIRQNVTIGVAQTGRDDDLPIVDDRADVGCEAAILGKIVVGKEVRIPANSVVVFDILDGATVIGVPAKVLSLRSSKQGKPSRPDLVPASSTDESCAVPDGDQ